MVNFFPFLRAISSNPKLAKWATYFLLVLLAWQGGKLFSSQLNVVTTPALPEIVAKPQKNLKLQGDDSLLFGKPEVDLTQTTDLNDSGMSPSEVDASRLRLKLVGAIAIDGKGVAIIESSGSTLVVSEGEEIISGVDLLKVYSDQVIILNRGKREKLMIEQGGKDLFEPATQSGAGETSEITTEHKQTLRKIGEDLRSNPISISKYIRFQPMNKDGKWDAVKIWPKSEPEIFNEIGFKAGDLLKSVNGRTIQEMAQEPSLWQAFLNESQFDLTIERQGQLVNLSVDLN
ncbi:type II secretion system protein GspC [Thiomicrorhabdus sp.]|uniref:type II secretion system protein GspC n=1 Tax=Thiomicrorhabdus sp. TaxID=2039724 RepID=UPI00356B5CA2